MVSVHRASLSAEAVPTAGSAVDFPYELGRLSHRLSQTCLSCFLSATGVDLVG